MLRFHKIDIADYPLDQVQLFLKTIDEENKERERYKKEQQDKMEERRQKRELERASSRLRRR